MLGNHKNGKKEKNGKSRKTFSFKNLDLFSYEQLVRTNGEEGHQTKLGAFISILILILVTFLFYPLIKEFFQRKHPFGKELIETGQYPTLIHMNTNISNNFMFGIGIKGLDLNAPKRYFNVSLLSFKTSKNKRNYNVLPLEPCSQSHWGDQLQQFVNSNLNPNHWLCPQVGANFSIEGKYSSQNFSYVMIAIHKCDQNNNKSVSCYSQAQIDEYLKKQGRFIFNFYYLNPWINYQEKDYFGYYLDEETFLYFDTKTGISSDLFFSDYLIETDNSLTSLPYIENKIEKKEGFISKQKREQYLFTIEEPYNFYLKFFLRKDTTVYKYTRSFTLIDSALAYLGGLVTINIIIVGLFMKFYNKHSYTISASASYNVDENGRTMKINYSCCLCLLHFFFSIKKTIGQMIRCCCGCFCSENSEEDEKEDERPFHELSQLQKIQILDEQYNKQVNIPELVVRINDNEIQQYESYPELRLKKRLKKGHSISTIRRLRRLHKKQKKESDNSQTNSSGHSDQQNDQNHEQVENINCENFKQNEDREKQSKTKSLQCSVSQTIKRSPLQERNDNYIIPEKFIYEESQEIIVRNHQEISHQISNHKDLDKRGMGKTQHQIIRLRYLTHRNTKYRSTTEAENIPNKENQQPKWLNYQV